MPLRGLAPLAAHSKPGLALHLCVASPAATAEAVAVRSVRRRQLRAVAVPLALRLRALAVLPTVRRPKLRAAVLVAIFVAVLAAVAARPHATELIHVAVAVSVAVSATVVGSASVAVPAAVPVAVPAAVAVAAASGHCPRRLRLVRQLPQPWFGLCRSSRDAANHSSP